MPDLRIGEQSESPEVALPVNEQSRKYMYTVYERTLNGEENGVVSLASKQLWYSALQVGCQTCIVDVSIVYITPTHKALGALLTAVTVKTDLQSTVVKKYFQFHFPLHHDYAIVRS